MFRVSVAEIVVFFLFAVGVYSAAPAFFEFPLLIVTVVALVAATLWLWFYLRLWFGKVVVIQGLGVALLSKDFQTAPIHANLEVLARISSLRNTHVVAVQWGLTRDFQENLMSHFNLGKFFDRVFYPSDFATSDPKEYLWGICRALGVSPSRVVLITGDAKAIEAGKALGIDAIEYSGTVKLAAGLQSRGL